MIEVYSISIDSKNYCFDFSIIEFNSGGRCHLKSIGCLVSIDGGRRYTGQRDNWWVSKDGQEGHGVDPVTYESAPSPYFF